LSGFRMRANQADQVEKWSEGGDLNDRRQVSTKWLGGH